MRVMGRASVASFLTVLLNVAWGLVALGLVLTPLLIVLAPVVEGPVEVSAGWVGVGTTMTIPVSFSVDARTHRVTAPALGVTDAQLQRARGLLQFPSRRSTFFVANVILVTLMFALSLWVIGTLRAVFRYPPRWPAVCEGQRDPNPIDRVARHHRRAGTVRVRVFRELLRDDPLLGRRAAFRRPAGPQRFRDHQWPDYPGDR